MEDSTTEYNLNQALGIAIGGHAGNYRRSNHLASNGFQGYTFHYEFFDGVNQLYACIHCHHRHNTPNLALSIAGLFPAIQHHLHMNGFPDKINAAMGGVNYHTIKIPIPNNGNNYVQDNADLMHLLIDFTRHQI